jgi:hypothetical protein
MERWPLYFSTFNLYLMHPASTVRQASSVVFKYLGRSWLPALFQNFQNDPPSKEFPKVLPSGRECNSRTNIEENTLENMPIPFIS